MKVLKKVEIENWSYDFVCKNCESELQADGKDILYSKYDRDQREPSYETFSVRCPVCNQLDNISKEKIPKLLQIEARDRTARSNTNYFDR